MLLVAELPAEVSVHSSLFPFADDEQKPSLHASLPRRRRTRARENKSPMMDDGAGLYGPSKGDASSNLESPPVFSVLQFISLSLNLNLIIRYFIYALAWVRLSLRP